MYASICWYQSCSHSDSLLVVIVTAEKFILYVPIIRSLVAMMVLYEREAERSCRTSSISFVIVSSDEAEYTSDRVRPIAGAYARFCTVNGFAC